MIIELNGTVEQLLDEHDTAIERDYNNFIIAIDKDENMIGHHDVLDGNHRLAFLFAENRLDEAEIYVIDYADFDWSGNDDEKEFFEKVKKLGNKISMSEIEQIV